MANIWIVEDDPTIGLLIEMTVKKAGHTSLRMLDASELEHALKKQPLPDLLLLDLMLREKNGFTVMKEWKADRKTNSIPVIIISARSAEHDKVMGLELGGEDYITKPFGVRELQARIQTALRRLPKEPEKILLNSLMLVPKTRDAYLSNQRIDLTQKEFELLLCLAKHRTNTVTRATIMKEVWGYDGEEDTTRTVDSHIKTLRIKLGDTASEPKFIQTIRGTGYRLIVGEDA